MSDTVLISTGARLHFGFFAHSGAADSPNATNYGGIGLMIDAPRVVLAASKFDVEKPEGSVANSWTEIVECNLKSARAADNDPFAGPPVDAWPDVCERVLSFLKCYREQTREQRPSRCSIEVWSAIPSHQGLGAGTQLGLAVAKAVSQLSDEQNIDAVTLAQRVGRGARSAIGIHGFERGGFLVDAGKEREESIGQLATRVDVPVDWRFVLIDPPGAAAGLSGGAESAALARLPGTSAEMTLSLQRRVSEEMLPALASANCDQFGEAMFEFGRTVGEYFRPVQGGTYAAPRAGELVEWIRAQGFRGVAQTSWGPTLAACCADQQSADLLCEKLHAGPQWSECRTRIVRPLNTGAKVQQISSSETL